MMKTYFLHCRGFGAAVLLNCTEHKHFPNHFHCMGVATFIGFRLVCVPDCNSSFHLLEDNGIFISNVCGILNGSWYEKGTIDDIQGSRMRIRV